MSGYPRNTIEIIERYSIPEPNTGCWLWTRGTTRDGYPVVRYRGDTWRAHRLSYTLHVGEIPAGLTLDHLCGVSCCVNPAHLEPVTAAVNILRGKTTLAALNAAKTHCKHGHEFTPSNTYRFVSKEGRHRRKCRACTLRICAAYLASKKP